MAKKWIMKNPIRVALHGDENKARSFMGEGKRILFQLHNMMDVYGRKQGTLTRMFGDTLVRATSLFSNDTIFIDSPPIVPIKVGRKIPVVVGKRIEEIEKEIVIEKEILVVGGYLNISPSTTIVDTWPLSLAKHTEAVAPDADDDDFFLGKMAIYNKKAEAWVGGGYDKVHCFDIKNGDYITSINVVPPDTWEQIYSIAIDESEDLLFVGTDHYPETIYVIDLKTRTIINNIPLITDNGYPYVMDVINKTYDDTKYHNLYVATNSNYIDYYSLPDSSYKGTVNLVSYGMQHGSSSINHRKGYIYYTNGFDDVVRLDVKTNSVVVQTYPNHECISTAVHEDTGKVYVLAKQKAGLGAKNAIVSFDEDLNLLSASAGFGIQYEWGSGIVIQHDGSHVYAILWGHSSNEYKGTVNKIKTGTLKLVDTQYSSHLYTSVGMYYEETKL